MEKLKDTDFREGVMIAKINELVDRVNELENHYHNIEQQDRDITTEPRYEQ